VHRAAFDDEDATYPNGGYSRTTLRRLCAALNLAPGHTLADLGCGHGGPGLWVAKQTGAELVGVDISPIGVALAKEQALRLSLADRARFQVGDLTATGLPDAACDAAMSLDVLIFVPDKAAAARECARILKPSGVLGLTTWEQSGYSERLRAEQCADYRPLLEATGFNIEAYEEPPDWQRQQRAFAEGLIAAESDMAEEMEPATAARFIAMAHGSLADMPLRRYIRISARKR
jgi:ubiquinone/menaquinone biosynthesis C-methylase UbiE